MTGRLAIRALVLFHGVKRMWRVLIQLEERLRADVTKTELIAIRAHLILVLPGLMLWDIAMEERGITGQIHSTAPEPPVVFH